MLRGTMQDTCAWWKLETKWNPAMEKVKAKSCVSCWGAGGEGSGDRKLHVKTSPCFQLRRGKHCLTSGSFYLPEPQCYAKDGLGEG